MPISGNGRGRFPKQFRGRHHAYAEGHGHGTWNIDFTSDLDASAPEEWREEIDQLLFPGGYFKEFIFLHKASGTLILADTIMSIELETRFPSLGGAPSSSPGYIIPTAKYYAVTATLPTAKGEGGDRKDPFMAFCSAMAAAFMEMPMKSSAGGWDRRPIDGNSGGRHLRS